MLGRGRERVEIISGETRGAVRIGAGLGIHFPSEHAKVVFRSTSASRLAGKP